MVFLEKYRIFTEGRWVEFEHYLDENGEDVHIEVK